MDYQQFDLSYYFQQFGYDRRASFAAFYGNKGQDLLGNFYQCLEVMEYQGIRANNTEALYQGSKFLDPATRSKFNHQTPLAAFFMARKLSRFVRPDWDSIKRHVMKEILEIKFGNAELACVLIATADKYLVEHCPVKGRDVYWSDNRDGTGRNELGKILMEIRQFYNGHPPSDPSVEYKWWLG